MAAGVDKNCHALRNSAATRVADAGATEAQLMALFGWTDPAMARLYTKLANAKKLAIEGTAKVGATGTGIDLFATELRISYAGENQIISTGHGEKGDMAKKAEGICRLTGARGRYVKAHIVPEALNITASDGKPLSQRERNGVTTNRWTSWYDAQLVTAKGEGILQRYDDDAIRIFREKKLIWSSWGASNVLATDDYKTVHEGMGLRTIADVDCTKLRLFFLSLLWRAAASTMREFAGVTIPDHDLDKLRKMVLHGEPEPQDFYPVSLIQLSTRSLPHNLAPGRLTKRGFSLDSSTGDIRPDEQQAVQVYRFFFDGLIAHLHFDAPENWYESNQATIVGDGREIAVTTITSETSWEMRRFSLATGKVANPADISQYWDDVVSEDTAEETAYLAFHDVFQPVGQTTLGNISRYDFDLDYQTYLSNINVFRKAWLKKDMPTNFYAAFGLQLLITISRKFSTVITQAIFTSRHNAAPEAAEFHVRVVNYSPNSDESFELLLWKFTRRQSIAIDWKKLDDRNFPKVADTYTFSKGYEARLDEHPFEKMRKSLS